MRRPQMKTLVTLLALTALSTVAAADEVWRWTDGNGNIRYSNQRELAPRNAVPVKTRIVVEAKQLPVRQPDLVVIDGQVVEAPAARPRMQAPEKRPRRIYTEERLRFGCYASTVLLSGGWAHPDDITAVGNCLPYLLGPEAWLNAARAELALREHGLDLRQVVQMYLKERAATTAEHVTDASDRD